MWKLTILGLVLAAAPARADWRYERATDPITDEITYRAIIGQGTAQFSFECSGGEMRALYRRRDFYASRDVPFRAGSFRVDSEEPISLHWYTEPGFALVIPRNAAQRPLLDMVVQAMTGRILTIRVPVSRTSFEDHQFTLANSGRVLGEVARNCEWAPLVRAQRAAEPE
jgi:hypothetical protein